jgi:transcriptional/translational regulatory protein YebC/TACO1
MFDRLGQIVYPMASASEDAVMEAAIEAGAEDVVSEDEAHTVFTAFEDLSSVADALEARFGAPKSTAIVWRPKSTTPVAGDQAQSLIKLLDALDDDDDVQTVFSNEDISEADLARLNG